MEISNFEQGLITAIENIKDNPTEGNVKALKSFFNKSFNSNQATLFEIFSGDRLTYEQQKILFDSIEVKQKCQLYNTISVDSRKNFYNSLSASDAKNFKESIRKQAVADAKILERDLLNTGFGTNDWSIEQIKDISSTKQNPIPMNFESSVWD